MWEPHKVCLWSHQHPRRDCKILSTFFSSPTFKILLMIFMSRKVDDYDDDDSKSKIIFSQVDTNGNFPTTNRKIIFFSTSRVRSTLSSSSDIYVSLVKVNLHTHSFSHSSLFFSEFSCEISGGREFCCNKRRWIFSKVKLTNHASDRKIDAEFDFWIIRCQLTNDHAIEVKVEVI